MSGPVGFIGAPFGILSRPRKQFGKTIFEVGIPPLGKNGLCFGVAHDFVTGNGFEVEQLVAHPP